MPMLVRKNPETPCPPDGAHHPHRMICNDYECDCWMDTDNGEPYQRLDCCVCGQPWPCPTKLAHVEARKIAARA